jgi:hypothetical protein
VYVCRCAVLCIVTAGQLMRDIPFRALQMPMYEKAVQALDSE